MRTWIRKARMPLLGGVTLPAAGSFYISMLPQRRHSRESGNPFCSDAKVNMDSRFRRNDGFEADGDAEGGLRLPNQANKKAALRRPFLSTTCNHASRTARRLLAIVLRQMLLAQTDFLR